MTECAHDPALCYNGARLACLLTNSGEISEAIKNKCRNMLLKSTAGAFNSLKKLLLQPAAGGVGVGDAQNTKQPTFNALTFFLAELFLHVKANTGLPFRMLGAKLAALLQLIIYTNSMSVPERANIVIKATKLCGPDLDKIRDGALPIIFHFSHPLHAHSYTTQ